MEHDLEEGAQVISNEVRMAFLLGGRVAELAADRRARRDRHSTGELQAESAAMERGARQAGAADQRARAGVAESGARAEERAAQAAHQVYAPLTDPRTFGRTEAHTVATAYATARGWAERDPRAQAAVSQLDGLAHDRWGVPAHRLAGLARDPSRDADALRGVTRELPQSLAERARDGRWLERASSEQLAEAWQQFARTGSDAQDRLRVEAAMGARFGKSAEAMLGEYRRQEEREAVSEVASARREAGRERATAQSETGRADRAGGQAGRFAQDLHHEQVGDPHREEFNVKASTGVQDRRPLMEGQAHHQAQEDTATARRVTAETHAQSATSRADTAAMERAGTPTIARSVRTETAQAFGTSTEQAVHASGAARKPATTAPRTTARVIERGR